MTKDDVLFGYRLRLFSLAEEIGVRPACRAMGVHHSTYYRWKPQVEASGLEMLRPRERRAPRMPNQIPAMVDPATAAFFEALPSVLPSRARGGVSPRIRAKKSPAVAGLFEVGRTGIEPVTLRLRVSCSTS
jgi:hypothetical protein